jgi:hypothetical protein
MGISARRSRTLEASRNRAISGGRPSRTPLWLADQPQLAAGGPALHAAEPAPPDLRAQSRDAWPNS